MVIGTTNGGLRIPNWVFGAITVVATIVSATIVLLRDRAGIEDRIREVERRQCAVLTYLAQQDTRFDSPIFREGCR